MIIAGSEKQRLHHGVFLQSDDPRASVSSICQRSGDGRKRRFVNRRSGDGGKGRSVNRSSGDGGKRKPMHFSLVIFKNPREIEENSQISRLCKHMIIIYILVWMKTCVI